MCAAANMQGSGSRKMVNLPMGRFDTVDPTSALLNRRQIAPGSDSFLYLRPSLGVSGLPSIPASNIVERAQLLNPPPAVTL